MSGEARLTAIRARGVASSNLFSVKAELINNATHWVMTVRAGGCNCPHLSADQT